MQLAANIELRKMPACIIVLSRYRIWLIMRRTPKVSLTVQLLWLWCYCVCCVVQVVLASVPDMQCGYSRELFLQWCSNSKNCIILTNRTQPGTLSRILVDNPLLRTITLDVCDETAEIYFILWCSCVLIAAIFLLLCSVLPEFKVFALWFVVWL